MKATLKWTVAAIALVAAGGAPASACAQDSFPGAQTPPQTYPQQQTAPQQGYPAQPGAWPQQPQGYPQQPQGYPQQPQAYPQQPQQQPQQPGQQPTPQPTGGGWGAPAAPPQPGPQQSGFPPAPPQGGADLDRLMQMERQDFGVAPTAELHNGQMHGPTPASIPGAQIVTTKGLAALVQGKQTPYYLFDVLGGAETLPGAIPAVWLAQPGTFQDQTQQQMAQMFQQGTQGRKDVPLIFYCLSNQCWMSYNAALRAANAGYKNVLWYRGGIEAWKAAGLPVQPAQQAQVPQQPGYPQQQGGYPQQQPQNQPAPQQQQQQQGGWPNE